MTSEARREFVKEVIAAVDGQPPTTRDPLPKHQKMAATPFRFLRGSASLFYADLARGHVAITQEAMWEIPTTRIEGDCHVSNFGFLTEEGAHSENVIFCPNDFDDAGGGHAAWDLARYIASAFLVSDYLEGLLAGRYTSEHAIPPGASAPSAKDAARASEAFLKAYRDQLEAIVKNVAIRDTAVCGFDKKHVLAKHERKAQRRAAGGRDFARKSSLAKSTVRQGDKLVFRDRPDRYKVLDPALRDELIYVFRPYVDDTVHDVVERLGAGTGSVDVARYYLLVGPDRYTPERAHLHHLVEVKRQRPAAMTAWFPDVDPINRLNPAHLTLDCQRVMQRQPDVILDEAEYDGHFWLVRTRHHARVGIDPEILLCKNPGEAFAQYGEACGRALALAHARGDRRTTDFELAMAGALFDETRASLVEFGRAYAARAREDCALLRSMLGLGDFSTEPQPSSIPPLEPGIPPPA